MNGLDVTNSTVGQSAGDSDGMDWNARRDELESSEGVPVIDPLERRFADIASTRPGWWAQSAIPSREALSVAYRATVRLSHAIRRKLGASLHPDGYIAFTLESESGLRFADVWRDHIEYELTTPEGFEEWSGALNADELRGFLDDDTA